MSQTYTFVERQGNQIFHRFVKDGRHKSEVVTEFPIQLYLRKETGQHRSLYGDALGKKSFEKINEARDFIDKYKGLDDFEIFGNDDFVQQFIADRYPDAMTFDLADFIVASIDIEVEHDNGFPEPDEAAEEIMSISMKVFGADRSICWGLKEEPNVEGVDYIQCDDEEELLKSFINKFREVGPHVFTGWNVYGFDVPYLVNRVNQVLGETWSNRLSMFSDRSNRCISDTHNKEGVDSYKILGTTVLDYLELYKKFNPDKQESYRLDYIAEVEEVGRKIDYSAYGDSLMRLYRENWPLFVKYNDVDNLLVEKLDEKVQYVQLAVAVAMLTKSRFVDSVGTVKIWDNLIYHMALGDNLQLPPQKRQSKAEMAGGYVRDAAVGLHRWPVVFDLTSLYPSIAILLNLSPETQMSDPMGGSDMVDKLLDGKVDPLSYHELNGIPTCFAVNGAQFRKDKHGIVARAMKFVFDERKRYKGLMKDAQKREEAAKKDGADAETLKALKREVGKWDAFQKAVKVVNNGGYGALGNPGFRYFRPAISEAITCTGQYIIRLVALRLNEYLNAMFKTDGVDYVLGSDTDSIMVTLGKFVEIIDPDGKADKNKLVDAVDSFCKKKIEPFLAKLFEEVATNLNAYENTLDMKREAISDVGIIRAKKNYAFRVWDMEGVRYAKPKLKIAGLETRRSDKPRIVRDELEIFIPMIFDQTEADIHKRVKAFKKTFMETPLPKKAFPKGVKEVKLWTTADGELQTPAAIDKKSVPFNSRAAVAYNKLLRATPSLAGVKEYIKDGSKIKYVPLKVPNPTLGNIIGFTDDLPEEFGIHKYIDHESLFEQAFTGPLNSLLHLVGWNHEEVATLDDLFD